MKYGLEVGQIVYFKCKVIKIDEANCNIHIEGANCGEQNIRFEAHPNSLMHLNKIITYYELVKRIQSSTPCDTPDDYYVLDCYENIDDAQKEVDRLNKELLKKIRKDPSYYNLNTEYYVRSKTLKLK